MSLLSNTALAFSMSADAFAASISKGVSLHKPKFAYALKIGVIFGAIETITPLIGWAIGIFASRFIADYDHWLAFVILAGIGGHMIYEGCGKEDVARKESHNIWILMLTAIGTSIDAMAVGVTLAFLNAHILLISAMIGGATFLMATIGIMTGHYIGTKAGKWAEIFGGLCLIGIGTKILAEHLGGIA